MTIHQAIASPGCGCDGRDMGGSLISLDAALARIATHAVPRREAETVPLEQASGRILARPVRSRSMAPSFDNAAMDGYAVATRDLTGEGPWRIRVDARLPAGQEAGPLAGASAARIFTGAPVPRGADAVVMQEEVTREGDVIRLHRRPEPGLNIRRAGSDMAIGAHVLGAGARLGPRQIAACAAAGAGRVRVRPRLRAALLVTGDEVRRAGEARGTAQIWDVNTPMMAASLRAAGVEIIAIARGGDNRAGLAQRMRDMAARADLVVTTGGISVGEEDHVKPALAALGGETLFSGVAIKPGKPVSFGRMGGAVWLGLPGNPLSAFVTWQVFGLALIRALSGETSRGPARRHVVTSAPVRRKPGRCEFRPATLVGFDAAGREVVQFQYATHSGRVGSLPSADGLILLPAEAEALPQGALVEFLSF